MLVLHAPGCLNVSKLSLEGSAWLSLQKQRSKGRGASETPAGQAAAQQNGVGPDQVCLAVAEQSKSLYCLLGLCHCLGQPLEVVQKSLHVMGFQEAEGCLVSPLCMSVPSLKHRCCLLLHSLCASRACLLLMTCRFLPWQEEKTLDMLFQRTSTKPMLYWLPVSEAQQAERKRKRAAGDEPKPMAAEAV